ncbi:MAG: hypothetical protein A3E37_00990 [Candidatus Andersenbacteria bacterium RIFCSPHIGHO2_12_FULL_46_9]|nr:MAG: hypothetical protein A3B76_02445 [Candidatus Andersenbacteria bacterium RIFCSPHIGHO2_02_FULL_46_16]OGY35607.1 MAG: hypothetical protein A3E37_00990 [Candidatus Andersenbacteria bacterium RIFCSPHIGHO2_12_FULL_46_9]OGY36459.1 MAG: hypothetical protein A3I08_01445 [Candidatus Andersenbacteria bacterium RIFCSPLOWO2_02_FULL_46_11]
MKLDESRYVQTSKAAEILGRSRNFVRSLGDKGLVKMFRDENSKNLRRAYSVEDLLALKRKFYA